MSEPEDKYPEDKFKENPEFDREFKRFELNIAQKEAFEKVMKRYPGLHNSNLELMHEAQAWACGRINYILYSLGDRKDDDAEEARYELCSVAAQITLETQYLLIKLLKAVEGKNGRSRPGSSKKPRKRA